LDEGDVLRAIGTIARQGDPDRYLATLFSPNAARPQLLALIAFNVELARIGEQVSEPELGEIRLQWWREALHKEAGRVTGNPVADAMARAFDRDRHLGAPIARLIDARSFDIAVKIMPDWSALEAYLHDTAGAMFAAAAAMLGAQNERIEPVAKAAGLAYGLTGLMRALPVHAAHRRVDLPADMLHRHGASPEQILAREPSAGLKDLLAELRFQARAALASALRHLRALDPNARTAFLPLALVEPYLRALERGQQHALRQVAGINPLYRLWRLATWRAA
jgi:phytoene synthase